MGGHISIRQVTSMDRKLEVRERMKGRYAFKNYPDEFSFRCKCIVVFQNLDGVDVMLFGLYVYEHGSENPLPNKNTVYVSYLDSVHYMRPRNMRTFIYHEILIAYLDSVRNRGFTTAHIWACPPLKGDDYILYAKPEDQKVPKDDRLRQWYVDMLVECQKRGVCGKVTNMYDHYFSDPKNDATVVPYMDGDYFPAEVENIIKDIEEGKTGKKGNPQGKKKKNQKAKQKKKNGRGGTRSMGLDEEALKASGLAPAGMEGKSLEEGGRDYVMVKLGETIRPMKESFIVAYLAGDGARPEDMVVPKEIQEYRKTHGVVTKFDKAITEGTDQAMSEAPASNGEEKGEEKSDSAETASAIAKDTAVKKETDDSNGSKADEQYDSSKPMEIDPPKEDADKVNLESKDEEGATKDGSKEETMEEPKEEAKDESKDESKEEPKADSKDDSKDDSKAGGKEESKEETEDEPKEESKDDAKEESKDAAEKDDKKKVKDTDSKDEDSKEESKDEESKEEPEGKGSKDEPKEEPEGKDSKDESKDENSKEEAKGEESKESGDEGSKEESKVKDSKDEKSKEESKDEAEGESKDETMADADADADSKPTDGSDAKVAEPTDGANPSEDTAKGSEAMETESTPTAAVEETRTSAPVNTETTTSETAPTSIAPAPADAAALAPGVPPAPADGTSAPPAVAAATDPAPGAAAPAPDSTGVMAIRKGKFAAMAAKKRDVGGEEKKPEEAKDGDKEKAEEKEKKPSKAVYVKDSKGRTVKVLDDDDEEMDCEFLNNRQAFLNLCQGNHYQFDHLRRAKHSSMMVLWHLHNRDAPKFVQQCATCSREILTGYRFHCPTCADFDQCQDCVQNPKVTRHPHQLKPIPIASGAQPELTEEQRKERQRSIQLHMTLLQHAATCTSAKCPSANCTKMKGLLKHGAQCQIKATGGCNVCKRIWALLQIHARQCKASSCPVPNCMAIRERVRQLKKQQQAMDDRRRQEMNRAYHTR